MTGPSRRALLRTAALLPAAALPGCSFFDDLFESSKPGLPGKRETVMPSTRGMQLDASFTQPVTLPAPVLNADWAQSGGGPAHVMGNVQLGDVSRRAWRRSIGEGGGYRQKITATPVIAGGQVFTMDSDGSVSAFDVQTGARRWNTDTEPKKDRSTNVGGGLAVAGGTVYATTGRAEALAIEAGSGKITWRSELDSPARSAPTVADNRLYVTTLDNRMLALSPTDGKRLWSYQATAAATSVLGEPAPAFADGLVVGGFGSGDLVTLRADSGTLAWSDSLASARGRNSLADLSAIRGLPVISDNVVYAIGVGGRAAGAGPALRPPAVGAGGRRPAHALGRRGLAVRVDAGPDAGVPEQGGWPGALVEPVATVWRRREVEGADFLDGAAAGGQYLYCAGSTEKLLAVNPATGAVLGQEDLPDQVSVGMVAAGGKLFVVTDDASLSAFG